MCPEYPISTVEMQEAKSPNAASYMQYTKLIALCKEKVVKFSLESDPTNPT